LEFGGSSQLTVFYKSVAIISFGPAVSSNSYTTITITVSSNSITLSNGAYSTQGILSLTQNSNQNTMFLSSNSMYSAFGSISSIKITGNHFA
jgi:hypothetical protein